jgi:alcohol dehydrogenase, propanol-preferring
MCTPCRRGRFVLCEKHLVCGISYDGGYCHVINVPQSALAKIPAGMPAQIAGPLACAGVTVFNAIRNMHIPQGRVVAIQGPSYFSIPPTSTSTSTPPSTYNPHQIIIAIKR